MAEGAFLFVAEADVILRTLLCAHGDRVGVEWARAKLAEILGIG